MALKPLARPTSRTIWVEACDPIRSTFFFRNLKTPRGRGLCGHFGHSNIAHPGTPREDDDFRISAQVIEPWEQCSLVKTSRVLQERGGFHNVWSRKFRLSGVCKGGVRSSRETSIPSWPSASRGLDSVQPNALEPPQQHVSHHCIDTTTRFLRSKIYYCGPYTPYIVLHVIER